MAKRRTRRARTVNKSQTIRDYISSNPEKGPKQISEELTAQGIKVSAAFVSNIKSKDKIKGGGRRRRGTAGQANGKVDLDRLIRAKQLAEELGGVDKARSALDALAKLVG